MKIFEINFMSTRDWWIYRWCDLISIDFILGTSKSASPRNENSNDKNIKFQSVRNCEKEIKSNLLMHVYVIQYQRFFDFGLIHVLLRVSRGKMNPELMFTYIVFYEVREPLLGWQWSFSITFPVEYTDKKWTGNDQDEISVWMNTDC